jgi:hypothetical protein
MIFKTQSFAPFLERHEDLRQVQVGIDHGLNSNKME